MKYKKTRSSIYLIEIARRKNSRLREGSEAEFNIQRINIYKNEKIEEGMTLQIERTYTVLSSIDRNTSILTL